MAKKKLPDDIKAFFARAGAKGGRKGGKSRMDALSPEQRSELGKKAAKARWGTNKTTTPKKTATNKKTNATVTKKGD